MLENPHIGFMGIRSGAEPKERTMTMRKILSFLLIFAVLAAFFPARSFAAGGRVRLYGCSFSADAEQVCFVKGSAEDALDAWAAETDAPEFKKYYYIGSEAVDIREIAEKLPALQSLFIVGCDVKNIDSLTELKNLTRLGLFGNDGAEDLTFVRDLTGLKKFRYRNMNCESVQPVSKLKKLTELSLDVPAKAIPDLSPFKGLTKMKKLTVGYGSFRDLSALKKMKNLRELEIDNHYLTDISALKSLEKLESLTLSRTEDVKAADLAELKQLTSLTLNNVRMRDFDSVSKLNGLKSLSVTGLTGISVHRFYDAVAHMTQLEALVLCDVSIYHCDFLKGLTNLRELALIFCDVDDISGLKNLKKLTRLILSYNQITELSALKDLKKLTVLELAGNLIEDISAVSGLTELRSLNLNGNQIRELTPAAKLKKLKYLGISGAYFADPAPILKLTGLRELFAPDSMVDGEFSEKYRKLNPECAVTYEWESAY